MLARWCTICNMAKSKSKKQTSKATRSDASDEFTNPSLSGISQHRYLVNYFSAATTNPKPADRYPNPGRPTKPADRYPDPAFRYPEAVSVDRYPDPLPPGRLPRRPVDRYPEATPNKPKMPTKPKPKKNRPIGGSGSGAYGII